MAECVHFGVCGGCAYQDLPYETQLELKKGLVSEALSDFESSYQLYPTLGSPKPYGYRHMIALSVKKRQGQLTAGFVGQDQRTFLPIESCPIADPRISAFIPKAISKLEALPPERKFNTSQMVLRAGSKGDVITSVRTDRGKDLECSVLGKTFSYAMSSFFQNNFSVLERFIQTIRDFLQPNQGTLFDLYSGVGLIGISLADGYERVIGIEEGYEAVKYAVKNAEQNHVLNCQFIEGKVEHLLPELIRQVQTPLHVVIDPPRIGLKPEVAQTLTALPIDKLLYVSCHLEALVRDLKILTHRFKITRVQPIDFFPQTKHVETLVLLEQK